MAAPVMHVLSAAVLLGLFFLPSSMAAHNILYGGEKLYADGYLVNGDYYFGMQFDCALVLYHHVEEEDQVLWSSPTNGVAKDCFAQFQDNGNLVIINSENQDVIWASNTNALEGQSILVLQRDGKVVIYGDRLWTRPQLKTADSKGAVVIADKGHNDAPTNRKIAMAVTNN
ncbi:mannose-specific lectin CEA-like [Curcuma longa]|uniref:mannose-specific lectin CEA-like n=1 Tax=Curcuma longa TaxID=136217 RepID=UPI003D9ECA20